MILPSEVLSNVPKDKFKIIFLILFLNGIGTLLPWNMLINADNYFVNYKLNVTQTYMSKTVKNYQNSFLSYLGIASKGPNILLQIINMFIYSGNANLSLRIRLTLLVQILVFIVIIGMAILDSSTWPGTFFWLTMLSAVLINLANGVYQGCVYGLAARFPMKYTNSVTMGMNVSGTIAALLMILSIAMSPEPKMEAILFFSSAVIILCICLIAEFYVKNNTFYQFYTMNYSKCNLKVIKSINSCPACFEKNYPKIQNNNDCPHLGMAIAQAVTYDGEKRYDPKKELIESSEESKLKHYLHVIRSIWFLLLNLILIYMVSLSLFPAVHARIIQNDNFIDDKYFSPIFCFLSFNLFATIGNFIAQFIQWPGPRKLIIFSLLRLLFIPFFLYCNYFPNGPDTRILPIIFKNDWMYILGSITMAISSGYLSSLCMMYAPKCLEPKYSTTAGMMGALTIILGILVGINASLLYPYFVNA